MRRAEGNRRFEPDPDPLNQDGDDRPVAQSWIRTEVKSKLNKVKVRHKWTIGNFVLRAFYTKVGDSLCGQVFSVPVEAHRGDGRRNLAFKLEIFPNGKEDGDSYDYVTMFVTSTSDEDLDVKYDFSVLSVDGASWGRMGNKLGRFSSYQRSLGYRNAFPKAKLIGMGDALLPDDKLTIVCDLAIYLFDRQTGGKDPTSSQVKHQIELSTPALSDDLANAASFGPNRSSFADVSLVCGNRTFWCHKFMLSARSDMFAAMFSHVDTKEGKTNKVEITDVEPDTMEQLLKFIYTDKLDETHLTNLACGLLSAADKYNVSRLKATCERVICDNLDVQNAVQALMLAYLHKAKTLQEAAIEFVTQNITEVSETPEWKQIVSEGHEALGEIIKSLMVRLKT